MEASVLIDFNPWWNARSVPERLLEEKQRDMYGELLNQISDRHVASIVGLRRTGKTTVMYQIIQHLMDEGVPGERILYFSFDRRVNTIQDITDTYIADILMEEEIKERTYFFFDEIQKLEGWQDQIKLLYDKRLPVKIFVSGSAGMVITRDSRETLAGRSFMYHLQPLTFREYLHLKGMAVPKFRDTYKTSRELRLGEKRYVAELNRFLESGGLPEAISLRPDAIGMYIVSSIVDQVIYKDIPSMYNIEEPAIIMELLRIIAERPGMLLNYDSLSSDLSRTRQTLSNYVFYLENAFLLRRVYNYSGSFITSVKKLKKVYFAHPCIAYALNPQMDIRSLAVENQVINELGIVFFHRDRGKEIDGILQYKDTLIPIEVKYKNNIKDSDTRTIRNFLEKNELNQGVVVTKTTFREEGNLLLIPAYMLLLYGKKWFESDAPNG